jgi:hypothetical protein
VPRRPRNRGIQRKNETIGLNENQLDHLINGSTWFFKTDDAFPFRDENHREQCWHRHKKDILAMMTDDETVGGFTPHLHVGQRPEAFFEYEDVPERTVKVEKIQPGNIKHPGGLEIENRKVQSTPDFLDEHGLWLTDEKRKYLAMREREQKQFQKLSAIVDLDEHRELHKTVRKTKAEYED